MLRAPNCYLTVSPGDWNWLLLYVAISKGTSKGRFRLLFRKILASWFNLDVFSFLVSLKKGVSEDSCKIRNTVTGLLRGNEPRLGTIADSE